ncbi:uncharacterized protein BKA78DRAFT_126124 [Phyllosticta capitalensis]|uniref:uncharacterized protein n=1 Tax=Phyllosticta capitalensis TaxID=121624 RepID=UPI00312E11B3
MMAEESFKASLPSYTHTNILFCAPPGVVFGHIQRSLLLLRRNARHQISCGHCIRKSKNSIRLPHPIYARTRARSTSNFEKRHDDELPTPFCFPLLLHTHTQPIVLPSCGLFGQTDGLLFLSYLLQLLRGGASPLCFLLSGAEFFSFVLWSGQLFGSILCCFFSFRVYWGERESEGLRWTERNAVRLAFDQNVDVGVRARTSNASDAYLGEKRKGRVGAVHGGLTGGRRLPASPLSDGPARRQAAGMVECSINSRPPSTIFCTVRLPPHPGKSRIWRTSRRLFTTCVEQDGGKALPELLAALAASASAETV